LIWHTPPRRIGGAARAMIATSGDGISEDDPNALNRQLGDILAQVDAARRPTRDPCTRTASITGIR